MDTMVEANARYAIRLTASQGQKDGEAAFRLLMLLQETYEGIVQPFVPSTKLLGALNRNSVSCYLDALLFAMFARLDSYEAMLYDNYEDIPRRRLAGSLRLWVNMLRKGLLITTDVTRNLQEAMADCGWSEATRTQQQDPSEAFGFITEKLGLPLMTLKMDLFHTGKEEPQDDHKFVHERLLEVAILDEPMEGREEIRLEDCLEVYFNNQVEIKRQAEDSRRRTLVKEPDPESSYPAEKTIGGEPGVHIEVAEVASTPGLNTGSALEAKTTPSQSRAPLERVRPGLGRHRGASIFSQRRIEIVGVDPDAGKQEGKELDKETSSMEEKPAATKVSVEVEMPAWQFFRMLPWYTDNLPTSDAQVAAHFSRQRPVLGICLKRYSYTQSGTAQRRGDYVDIPLEIAIPKFVGDEDMEEGGPLFGNFRLILQSVVCHRGVSVHSGHYITLSRGQSPIVIGSGFDLEDESEDPWMRFDDLAQERVTYVDMQTALREETPYLVFYQIQPIHGDGTPNDGLPSYAEATSRAPSDHTPSEKPYIPEQTGSDATLERVRSSTSASEATDWAPSGRTSLDINTALDRPRGRNSTQIDDARRSITTASDFGGSVGSLRTDATFSVPSTPSEEKPPAFSEERNATGLLGILSSSGRRGGRISNRPSTSKSRPTSTDGGNNSRFSLNMSKLSAKKSRTDMAPPPLPVPATDETRPSLDEAPRQSSSVDGQNFESVGSPTPGTEALSRPDSDQSLQDSGKDIGQEPDASRHRLTRKEKAAVKQQEKKGRKKGSSAAEDRDCVVM